jgi:hypothetical protein
MGDNSRALPNLDGVPVHKPFCFLQSGGIVGQFTFLGRPGNMAVILNNIKPIIGHDGGAGNGPSLPSAVGTQGAGSWVDLNTSMRLHLHLSKTEQVEA